MCERIVTRKLAENKPSNALNEKELIEALKEKTLANISCSSLPDDIVMSVTMAILNLLMLNTKREL